MSHLPWAYSDPIDAEGWEHDEPSGPFCEHCGQDLDWEDCDQCGGEGYFDDERLMDEDPLWYQPGDTERCEQCGGDGGWHFCTNKKCPGETNIA